MKERQANIQLLNSKLAELEVPDNALLWEKIEAQLAQFPMPQTAKPTVNAGMVKSVILKIVVAVVIGSSIAILCWLAFRKNGPVHPVTPSNKSVDIIPVQSTIQPAGNLPAPAEEIQNIQPKHSGSQANQLEADLPGRRLTKDSLLIQSSEKPVNKGIQGIIADSLQGRNVLITSQNDTTRPGTISSGTQEAYYFDVQKKKGKKNE